MTEALDACNSVASATQFGEGARSAAHPLLMTRDKLVCKAILKHGLGR